ncbi:MAG TPA: hypothetical protein VGO60_00485 [Iamia sp.]|nr:hypothetical protein [Iamia sp.]
MDPQVDVLHGPNPIQGNGTVSIPRDLLRAIGLDPTEPGHRVHWLLNPDMPGTLVLVPAEMVERAHPGIVTALKQASS